MTSDVLSTRQRILNCALDLFAQNGYSETSIRDIAFAVGINPASLYFHFASKEELLLAILEEYHRLTGTIFQSQDIKSILQENPTAEGVTACIAAASAPILENKKLLFLVYQEQHRIPEFGVFVLSRFREVADYISRIVDTLKELRVINNDANAELCGDLVFSLLYAFLNYTAIYDKRNSQDYPKKELREGLFNLFDTIIRAYKYSEQDIEQDVA